MSAFDRSPLPGDHAAKSHARVASGAGTREYECEVWATERREPDLRGITPSAETREIGTHFYPWNSESAYFAAREIDKERSLKLGHPVRRSQRELLEAMRQQQQSRREASRLRSEQDRDDWREIQSVSSQGLQKPLMATSRLTVVELQSSGQGGLTRRNFETREASQWSSDIIYCRAVHHRRL